MSGSGTKAVIKNADMSEEMQADAIDCATTVRIELRKSRTISFLLMK